MIKSTTVLQPIARPWRRWGGRLLIVAIVVGPIVGGYASWRYQYPYGWSHACDKGLWSVLLEYAHAHAGNFPAGEATPEASLSLIGVSHAHYLAGKRLSPADTEAILASGQLLDPSTCGWNYVEGLTKDDHQLALFWDKEGLNHNGGRLRGGGHIVMFASGMSEHIPAADWEKFLAEQQTMWKRLEESGRRIRMSESGRLPAGAPN